MGKPAIVRTIYIDFINSSNIKIYVEKVLKQYHLQIIKDLTTHLLHKSDIRRAYPVKCERITFAGLTPDFHKFERSIQWEHIMSNCNGVLTQKCVAY